MKKEIKLREIDVIESMREALSHARGKLRLKVTKVRRLARNSETVPGHLRSGSAEPKRRS